ncbi:MAG: glyoxalase [Candidatus Aegiribacteria sp. MLS_C]|nr:MAG: glyoxalase [Candidatus Aegiribacteria sp. MLS_C]
MRTDLDSQIVFFYTRDLEATSRFYEDVIGLEMVLDQGGCRIFRTTGSSFLGFCGSVDAGSSDGVVLTLVTEDVDGWFEELSARGGVFEKEPASNRDYHIYHCFLRDPNGYVIEIQRFEDPRWKN